jgi:periplasmic protein CpxP/Spy
MASTTTLTYRLAATALMAALALPALAQTPLAAQPAAAAPAAQTTRPAAPAAERGDHRERHRAHHAQRLAALKDQLQLTAAQEAAWTTYASALQPGERYARMDRKDMEQLTTPERIDRMRALRAQRSAEADRRGEATKAFYATLTPQQQKTFDTKAHRGGHYRHGQAGEHRHSGGAAKAGAPAAAGTAAPLR